jgi:hypothetical protein
MYDLYYREIDGSQHSQSSWCGSLIAEAETSRRIDDQSFYCNRKSSDSPASKERLLPDQEWRCAVTLLLILVVVWVAGGFGGAINALMSDNGFIKPKSADTNDGRIWRPGFLGNILIGGIAAVISWGLYGPFAAYPLIGGSAAASSEPVMLSLSAFVGALLVGVGGARWLTNEVDKTLLRAAASQAAAGPADIDKAAKIMTASPAQALSLTAQR